MATAFCSDSNAEPDALGANELVKFFTFLNPVETLGHVQDGSRDVAHASFEEEVIQVTPGTSSASTPDLSGCCNGSGAVLNSSKTAGMIQQQRLSLNRAP